MSASDVRDRSNSNGEAELVHTSFPKNKIKILLLENIHANAVKAFTKQEFQVECHPGTLSEEQLLEKVEDVHVLGIRSRTQLTDKVFSATKRLLVVGCFCIGTNQVDLLAAEKRGVPVFNSPFSNSRSVAELMIGEIISLSRHLGDRNKEMHTGVWKKTDKGCREIRGKTLGIVGYGHIGSQLSVLAESMGLKVLYYDIKHILAMGNSTRCPDLESLLRQSDFVSLHVPETTLTKNMISQPQIELMKEGAILLNASRGTVVDVEALAEALRSGRLGGAAIDVYPTEPESNTDKWQCVLQNCPNTILTPHIGGSTMEAQAAIGDEVAHKLIRYVNTGRTGGAVNFPIIEMQPDPASHRILNIHKNVPGVLKEINSILCDFNVNAQQLGTTPHIGYLVVDVDREASKQIKERIAALQVSIRTRILY